MDDKIVRCTLRMDRQLFAKFRYIADFEGRSANRAIEQMIKKKVDAFENSHGKIEITEDEE